MESSACAIYDCGSCGHVAAGDCRGCRPGNARLGEAGRGACGVYACVVSRGIESCSECAEPSCVLRRNVESICPLRSEFENKRWWAGGECLGFWQAVDVARATPMMRARYRTRSLGRLRWYLTALDGFAAEGYGIDIIVADCGESGSQCRAGPQGLVALRRVWHSQLRLQSGVPARPYRGHFAVEQGSGCCVGRRAVPSAARYDDR